MPPVLDIRSVSSYGSRSRGVFRRDPPKPSPPTQPPPPPEMQVPPAATAVVPSPPEKVSQGPRSLARLNSYSGDGTEPWGSHQVHVLFVARANGWGCELTKTMLVTTLTGAAQRHVQTLPELLTMSLQDLLDAMADEFGRPVPRMTLISQLNGRMQGPKESYRDLGKSIASLVQQAYPNLNPDQQEDAACIRYREAIRCKEVRFHVEHLHQYAGLQDLVEEAEVVARILPRTGLVAQQSRATAAVHVVKEEEEGDLPSATGETSAPTDLLDERIAELIARVGSMESRQKASLDQRTCYHCQQKGHISYDCTNPKKEREGGQGQGKSKRKRNKKKKDSSSSDTDQAESAGKEKEDSKSPQPKPTASPSTQKPGNGK